MTDTLSDWEPAPQRAKPKRGVDGDEARGWINVKTDEVVIRRPLIEDNDDLPTYGVYSFLKVNKQTGLGTNRSLLFRDDDANRADERITNWLERTPTPDNPGQFDTALNPTEIRRAELSHVASLKDWAHLTGAEYYQTEKIGSRKQSSGPVAIFDGSVRWGEGAYIALAKVDGPGGRRFASIGYRPDGYYTTDPSLSGNPFEVRSPTVEFDGQRIHISRPDGTHSITVTALTDTPTHSLNDDWN